MSSRTILGTFLGSILSLGGHATAEPSQSPSSETLSSSSPSTRLGIGASAGLGLMSTIAIEGRSEFPLTQRNALTLQVEAVLGHIAAGDDDTTFSSFGGSVGYRRFSESTRYFFFAELGAGYSPELFFLGSEPPLSRAVAGLVRP